MDQKEKLKEIMSKYPEETIGLYKKLMRTQKEQNNKNNTKIKEYMMGIVQEVIE